MSWNHNSKKQKRDLWHSSKRPTHLKSSVEIVDEMVLRLAFLLKFQFLIVQPPHLLINLRKNVFLCFQHLLHSRQLICHHTWSHCSSVISFIEALELRVFHFYTHTYMSASSTTIVSASQTVMSIPSSCRKQNHKRESHCMDCIPITTVPTIPLWVSQIGFVETLHGSVMHLSHTITMLQCCLLNSEI